LWVERWWARPDPSEDIVAAVDVASLCWFCLNAEFAHPNGGFNSFRDLSNAIV
jgi:hypothetical protein